MLRLLPLLLPARPMLACGFEAALPPTTAAPTGRPARKSGNGGGGSAGCRLTAEEIAGARVADASGVEQARREDVGFFEAEDLFAERERVGAVGIGGSGGEVVAVVDGVDGGERIFLARRCDRGEVCRNLRGWFGAGC